MRVRSRSTVAPRSRCMGAFERKCSRMQPLFTTFASAGELARIMPAPVAAATTGTWGHTLSGRIAEHAAQQERGRRLALAQHVGWHRLLDAADACPMGSDCLVVPRD